MGRPKKDEAGLSARERIVETFWELLSQDGFDAITVMGLCNRAHVNHNTFYKHFGCMENLAREAFQDIVLDEAPITLIAQGETVADSFFGTSSERFARAFLFAQSNSPLLREIFLEHVRKAWLDAAGRSLDELSKRERTDLDIVFGGLVYAIANSDSDDFRGSFASLSHRPLGKAMLQTLSSIQTNDLQKQK